jgi:PAS domain S-box-containing protein
MAAAAVNAYLESLWASHEAKVADPAGELALNLFANANSIGQRAVLDALPALIFLEREGKIIFANCEARMFLNGSAGEWTERPIEEVLWGLLPGTAEPQTRLKGTRLSRPFHATMPLAGGEMMPVEGTYSVLGDSPSESVIVAWPGVHERAPKSTFMEDVLASLPEAVAIEHGKHILYTNPAFTRLFGYSANEGGVCNMSQLMMESASPVENAVLSALLDDQEMGSFEAMLRGETMNLTVEVAPLVVKGEVAGRVFTFREAPRQNGTGNWQFTEDLENQWGTSVIP